MEWCTEPCRHPLLLERNGLPWKQNGKPRLLYLTYTVPLCHRTACVNIYKLCTVQTALRTVKTTGVWSGLSLITKKLRQIDTIREKKSYTWWTTAYVKERQRWSEDLYLKDQLEHDLGNSSSRDLCFTTFGYWLDILAVGHLRQLCTRLAADSQNRRWTWGSSDQSVDGIVCLCFYSLIMDLTFRCYAPRTRGC